MLVTQTSGEDRRWFIQFVNRTFIWDFQKLRTQLVKLEELEQVLHYAKFCFRTGMSNLEFFYNCMA